MKPGDKIVVSGIVRTVNGDDGVEVYFPSCGTLYIDKWSGCLPEAAATPSPLPADPPVAEYICDYCGHRQNTDGHCRGCALRARLCKAVRLVPPQPDPNRGRVVNSSRDFAHIAGSQPEWCDLTERQKDSRNAIYDAVVADYLAKKGQP